VYVHYELYALTIDVKWERASRDHTTERQNTLRRKTNEHDMKMHNNLKLWTLILSSCWMEIVIDSALKMTNCIALPEANTYRRVHFWCVGRVPAASV